MLLFWFQLLFTLVEHVRKLEHTAEEEAVQTAACTDLLNSFCATLLSTEEHSASTSAWFSSTKENAKKNVLSTK